MRHPAFTVVACLVVLSLFAVVLAADIDMDVQVSPNCLVLKAPANWITIHTDLTLSSVDQATVDVSVNGTPLPIAAVFADARGDMVLKIRQSEVEEYVSPLSATFTVTGATSNEETFEGSDTIRVRN